ncbi:MAG: sulfur carrier protein ThiS [Chloroflexi bacterium]|jgi:thiamine biosynthesis protein ThiS|nr:sulfur carrier protein ThiS [Anaerolineaceae bacterium]NLI45469.1 sulfur carrier protein ThiS [Chloroflexota bacterium]HOE35167.1 sulfur carrier protein ThiS [Anaerolineaceae bacterium]HOT26282.1 sulfur carrier protein ThiS [Anaerolineaceae bacterium]HQK04259.1 sulfur carrier protein ThiS [Anaerolineaceae bacterium]
MITVNTRENPWREGLTVQALLDEMGFIFRHIIVRVNGEFVPEEAYAQRQIADGDDVQVMHLIAGG